MIKIIYLCEGLCDMIWIMSFNRIRKYRGSLTLFLLIRSALFEHKH